MVLSQARSAADRFHKQVYPVEVRSTLAFPEEKLHRTAASQAQVLRKPIEQGKHT